MRNVVIRKATLKDIKLLDNFQQELGEYERKFGHLSKKGHLHYFSEKELKKIFRSGAVFIAYDKEKPIGCIAAEIENVTGNWCKYKKRGMIHLLFVKQRYRRKGVGSKLITNALSYLKAKKLKWIGIRALSKNKQAMKLYERFGFKELQLEMKL